MSDFKSDRSAATTPPAGAPAPCTLCRPPNGRAAPDDDLEPMSSATTACGSTKEERRTHATPPPRTRTERFRQRLQRRLGKAGAPRDRARATAAERLVLRPRHRHGILRRAWPRLAAAVCRPVDRFAARQTLDTRLAAARLERVLGIRRRLGNAVQTAMDAVLIARAPARPLRRWDRCWARHKHPRRLVLVTHH